MEQIAGVLVTRRTSGYKDIPGVRYHFPKGLYINNVLRLVGKLVLLYEPRRGGTSESSGGREGFVACAFVDELWDDPNDPTHAFLSLRYYTEFVRVVRLNATSLSRHSMQRAVRDIAYAEAEAVVALGMSIPQSIGQPREGLTDTEVLSTVSQREIREVVLNQTIRDATFRYRVVEDAYEGRCALTGVRMTNGFGRAEVDAAHIRPVEDGGPDSTRNGMALMKTMHWAFDRGLISLENDGRILTVERGLDDRVLRMLPDDRQAIWPKNQVQQPHHSFLEWHRTTCFKGPVVQNAP